MRFGIRSRLIIAFIMVIVVFIICVVLSLLLFQFQVYRGGEMESEYNVRATTAQVFSAVENNYGIIDKYEQFAKKLEPLLDKDNMHLQVIDNSGVLLYDSQDKEASVKKTRVDLAEMVRIDPDFQEENPTDYREVTPVVIDDSAVATAVLVTDMNPITKDIILSLLTAFGTGLIIFIALITLLAWLIARDLLVPLGQLTRAAENIAQGNLDEEVSYRKGNEIGKVCQAFETMRIELKKSLDTQAAYEESRKELVASISHDLRTPISSIKGYVAGLQDGIAKDKESFARYLTVIRDKTDSLDRLIDDLFQFSRLELGKLSMEMKDWNSEALLEDILEPIEMDFGENSRNFRVARPLPGVTVRADYYRIEQVINNLVQNAARYTDPDGFIEFRAKTAADELIMSVSDNGCGISGEDLPRIFERFYRGEKSRSRNYGGAGLGLVICKQIIEVHGGRIWAESRPGEGSSFYFALPIVAST